MATTKVQGKIIHAGYEWTLRIVLDATKFSFPPEAEFVAQVRRDPAVADILATMSTANGGIVVSDGHKIDLILTGAQSAGWPNRKTYIDIVRTDTDPKEHLGFRIVVPVTQPITRL